MCKRKESNFIFLVLFYYFFIFINNKSKLRKLPKNFNIPSYSNHVKKQFCRMNGVRFSTVIVSANRDQPVDPVRRSFVRDGSL